MDKKLHSAPIKDPQRILDIGTGTGIWAMEMGDKFPNAEASLLESGNHATTYNTRYLGMI
jgi:methylase of polypeptide subunit release factors